jgi:hypothetical protein
LTPFGLNRYMLIVVVLAVRVVLDRETQLHDSSSI